MEPKNTPQANGHGGHDVHLVSAASVDRLRLPLSVAYGYVQLLQRQLRRGDAIDTDQVLQSLERTEDALRAIKTQLRELTETKG